MGIDLSERTLALITSRWDSKRLPGKALIDIEGIPLLQRVVNQARKAFLDDVVVATTIYSIPIIEYCLSHNIKVYAHPFEDDILGRLYCAAELYKADVVLRLWGDCPLVDPFLIRQVAGYWLYDYVYFSNQFGGVANIKFTTLEWKNSEISDPKQREWFHTHMLATDCHKREEPVLFSVDDPDSLEKVRAYVKQ